MASSMSWPACSTGSMYRRAQKIRSSLIPMTVTPAICRPVALQCHSLHTTSPSVLCLSTSTSRSGKLSNMPGQSLCTCSLPPKPRSGWAGCSAIQEDVAQPFVTGSSRRPLDRFVLLLFGGLYGCSFGDSGQGGPGYTGVVVHLGCHYLRARREMGEELLGLLANAAADDDEIGPEQEFDPVKVLVEALGVLFPAQIIALAGTIRGAVLGVLTPDLDVPELGVRHQPAADEEGGAYAGAQREHHDDAVLISASAPADLSQASRVSIVYNAHGGVDLSLKRLAQVEADRSLVYIRRRLHDTALDDGREPAADGAIPPCLTDHLDRRPDDSLGCGRLGSLDPHPLLEQLTRLRVHGRALDPRPSNIYTEHVHVSSPNGYRRHSIRSHPPARGAGMADINWRRASWNRRMAKYVPRRILLRG